MTRLPTAERTFYQQQIVGAALQFNFNSTAYGTKVDVCQRVSSVEQQSTGKARGIRGQWRGIACMCPFVLFQAFMAVSACMFFSRNSIILITRLFSCCWTHERRNHYFLVRCSDSLNTGKKFLMTIV